MPAEGCSALIQINAPSACDWTRKPGKTQIAAGMGLAELN
jgi:hypothetical protein